MANDGTTTVNGSDYKVAFYLNDKLLGKMEGQDIAPAQILPYVFDQGTVPAEATDSLNLQVVLEATDGNMANNQSAIYVPVTPLGLLGVENLQATAQGRDNVISWTAPQTQGVPVAVFEGFESYESWTHEVPGWKVIDTDASSTVAIYGLNLPGMTRDDPSTWTVLDWAATDLETNFANQSSLMQTSRPHLGGKSMACLVPNSTMGNDWLISPELSGEAQTVSLYASKLSWNYTEPWELRYSTTTTTTTAFKPITSPSAFKGGEAKIMIPAANFSHFEFNLPKGAKYIAVHYTSQGMMLELDDFAFTAKGNQQIQGYDVLRDGEVIATVTNSSYTDPNPAQASEYGVRVRYADGTLSLPVTVTAPEATVITQVEIDDNTTSNTAVYNLQGIKVGNTTTGLPTGIYITRGHKVIVK